MLMIQTFSNAYINKVKPKTDSTTMCLIGRY